MPQLERESESSTSEVGKTCLAKDSLIPRGIVRVIMWPTPFSHPRRGFVGIGSFLDVGRVIAHRSTTELGGDRVSGGSHSTRGSPGQPFGEECVALRNGASKYIKCQQRERCAPRKPTVYLEPNRIRVPSDAAPGSRSNRYSVKDTLARDLENWEVAT